jgi:hypothetical protein
MTMLKQVMLVLAVATMGGCAISTDQLRETSMGHVGCSEDQMAVQNVNVDYSTQPSTTWEVMCGGSRYICSGMVTPMGSQQVACTAAVKS